MTLGVLVETILSALYAPIMMLVQTQHIIEFLTGRDSGWNAQRRHAHMTTWKEAWNFHWPHLVIGIVIGVIAFLISPTLFAWLTPTLAGLLLAVPLSKISGSVKLGRFFGWFRILRTPEEKHVPPVIRRRDELLAQSAARPTGRTALHRAQPPGAFSAHFGQSAAAAGNPWTSRSESPDRRAQTHGRAHAE